MYNLHNIYITERTIITRDIILEYLKEQSPGFIVNLLKNKY